MPLCLAAVLPKEFVGPKSDKLLAGDEKRQLVTERVRFGETADNGSDVRIITELSWGALPRTNASLKVPALDVKFGTDKGKPLFPRFNSPARAQHMLISLNMR